MSTELSKLTSAPLPDVCRNKHQGNTESELANVKVHTRKEVDRQRIIAYADFMAGQGITLHEVMKALDMKAQTASARLSELKAENELIRKATNERRDGCGVFVRPKNGQLSLL